MQVQLYSCRTLAAYICLAPGEATSVPELASLKILQGLVFAMSKAENFSITSETVYQYLTTVSESRSDDFDVISIVLKEIVLRRSLIDAFGEEKATSLIELYQQKTSKGNSKMLKAGISALAYTCIKAASIRNKMVDYIFTLSDQGEVDTLFCVGDALGTIFFGPDARSLQNYEIELFEFDHSCVEKFLKWCFKECGPEGMQARRRAIAIWLLSLVKDCLRPELLMVSLLPLLSLLFLRLEIFERHQSGVQYSSSG